MKIIRAILDLPWWGGLPIFFIGNLTPHLGIIGFSFSTIVCLFGLWIFSKLLSYDSKEPEWVFVGLPLFSLSLYLIDPVLCSSYKDAYIIRSIVCVFFGLITVRSFANVEEKEQQT